MIKHQITKTRYFIWSYVTLYRKSPCSWRPPPCLVLSLFLLWTSLIPRSLLTLLKVTKSSSLLLFSSSSLLIWKIYSLFKTSIAILAKFMEVWIRTFLQTTMNIMDDPPTSSIAPFPWNTQRCCKWYLSPL